MDKNCQLGEKMSNSRTKNAILNVIFSLLYKLQQTCKRFNIAKADTISMYMVLDV